MLKIEKCYRFCFNRFEGFRLGILKYNIDMYIVIKEIEIIHRSFLVIAMNCQASSMNH